jgi:hypothetical protein
VARAGAHRFVGGLLLGQHLGGNLQWVSPLAVDRLVVF